MFSRKAIKLITSAEAPWRIGYLTSIRRNTTVPASQAPTDMVKSINSVELLGRVEVDPQLKGSEDYPVVVFSMATDKKYWYESGEFLCHRIICFKPRLLETVLNYLRKGQRVHVTGRITYVESKDDDGKVKVTTAIQADNVIFSHSVPDTNAQS